MACFLKYTVTKLLGDIVWGQEGSYAVVYSLGGNYFEEE